MNLHRAAWIALLALPLCAAACSKADTGAAEGAAKAQEKTADSNADGFGRLTVEELQAKIADAKSGKLSLYIYDNNGQERFQKGHIPGAKWVQFDEVKPADLPADKEATLVFYCANERCSACHSGAKAALALGYKHVFILPAGISGWEKAQQPVETA